MNSFGILSDNNALDDCTVLNRTCHKLAESFRPLCLTRPTFVKLEVVRPASRSHVTSSLTQMAVRHHGSASLWRVLFKTVQSSSALLSDKVPNEITNLYVVREMTLKGHSRSSTMSSFVRLSELSVRDCKVGCTYFHTKIAKMTVKIDRCHWW